MTLGFFLKWQVSTPTIHTLPSWEYTDGSTLDAALAMFARRNRLKVLSVSSGEIWLEAKDGAEVCYTVIEREE